MVDVVKKLLALVIIILLVGVSIPSTGRVMEQASTVSSDGITLYVGGDGPGNYTKIQDAIDNASDGDTVFVYNGTYVENVVVNKSINLIGKNRDTTIIDSNPDIKDDNAIIISSDCVNVSGFTIRNRRNDSPYLFCGGIKIYDDNIRITGNCFVNNTCGIKSYGEYNIIGNNIISNCSVGVFIDCTFYDFLCWNTISNCREFGIFINQGYFNIIMCNNFIENKCHIGFEYDFIAKFCSIFLLRPLQLNKFLRNYYDKHPARLPKVIRGIMVSNPGGGFPEEYDWFNFDWRPALLPYKIGV